jgi:hypothetical protein
MTNAYQDLVKKGFVGRVKRDVLLEASVDLEYLGAIRAAFDDAGESGRREATACAVQLIEDLLAKGLCSLATWSGDQNSGPNHVTVQKSRDEIEALVAESSKSVHCFEYFLLSTPAGDEWVSRYDKLIAEL